MKNVYFLLSALLMWNCCAESNYRTSATPDFKEIYRLKGDSLPAGELFIPLHLKMAGEDIVLFDNNNREGVITVAGCPGLNFKYRAVRKGRGRDEFISSSWAHALQPDRIALYDIPGAVLADFTIQKDTLVPGRQYDLTRKKEGTDLTRPYVDIIQLNDSVFFMRSSDRSRDELTVDNLVTGKTLWTVKDIADRDLSKDQYLDYNYYIAAGKK